MAGRVERREVRSEAGGADQDRPAGTWSTIALALIGQFGVSMSGQGISALIPFIQSALSLTRSQIGLFSTVAHLGDVVTFYGGGWIADTIGVRKLIVAATSCVGLGLIGLSFANGLPHVLGVLFLTGIGIGLGSPAVAMIILRNFEPERRGFAMSIKQTGVPIVGLAAAAILPALAEWTGWRIVSLGIGVLAIALGLVVFVRYQDRAPVAPVEKQREKLLDNLKIIITNANVLIASVYAIALIGLQFCVLSYFLLYFQTDLQWSVVTAGWMLALAQFGAIAGRIAWGYASDRILKARRKPVFVISGALAALFAAALALLGPATPAWAVAGVSFALGLSALGWHGVFHAEVGELVSPELSGQAIGTTLTLSQLGPILAPPIFGFIVDQTNTYQPAWLLFAGITAAATLLLALFLHEPPANREEQRAAVQGN